MAQPCTSPVHGSLLDRRLDDEHRTKQGSLTHDLFKRTVTFLPTHPMGIQCDMRNGSIWIAMVQFGSQAEVMGVQQGWVIESINGQYVASSNEMNRVLKNNRSVPVEVVFTDVPTMKQNLGVTIFQFIEQREPLYAAKLTGMIMEMDHIEVLRIVQDPHALESKFLEARAVLFAAMQHTQQTLTSSPRSPVPQSQQLNLQFPSHAPLDLDMFYVQPPGLSEQEQINLAIQQSLIPKHSSHTDEKEDHTYQDEVVSEHGIESSVLTSSHYCYIHNIPSRVGENDVVMEQDIVEYIETVTGVSPTVVRFENDTQGALIRVYVATSTQEELLAICSELPKKGFMDRDVRVELPQGSPASDKATIATSAASDKATIAAESIPQIVDDDIPDEFECPITKMVMEDPVIAADGRSYERSAIEEWLELHTTSPMTNKVLSHRWLTPNLALKNLISDWHSKRKRDP